MNYDYIKDRFGILKCFLFSALMPDHRFHYAANLDWNPRFLEPEERKRIERNFEYQGSNIPRDREKPFLIEQIPIKRSEWKKAIKGKKF